MEGEIVHLRRPEVEGGEGVQVTAATRATVIAAGVEVEGGMGEDDSGLNYQVRKVEGFLVKYEGALVLDGLERLARAPSRPFS